MMNPNDAHVLLRAFCDELARSGVTDACTSPGSRCAPILLALSREPGLRCHSHVDERCSGFFALGLAKATRRPVAITCTSGTAAAELAPAVHEAREARVPLIVLTADRPPELREIGAGQVVDQVGIYGRAAKWFFEVGTHDATEERLRWMRALACRAVATSLDGRPGVVHLNFPLRDPLVPQGELPPDVTGRAGGAPQLGFTWEPQVDSAASGLRDAVERSARGVIVCGREERSRAVPAAVAGFAGATGYPVLADPLSGARRGPQAVAHYDALLRDDGFAAASRPDLVLRVGDLPTSKPLRAWLAGARDAEQVVLDPEGALQDPDSAAGHVLRCDPATVLAETTEQLGGASHAAWLAHWRDADSRAAGAIARTLGDELSEPRVAAELGARLPGDVTLFVASSMPIRDMETFAGVRDDAPRVLSNRGANGIDGTVSSAFGAAAAGDGPVVLLIGDVALAHDIGGLLAAKRLGLRMTIVLLNNDGGGIFHFLSIAGESDVFEDQIATPTGLDFARAADLYGCGHVVADNLAELREALDGGLGADRTTIVEVRTDRAENLALHRAVWDAVGGTLAE